MIIAFAMEINNISARIFLFSVLFIPLKNDQIQIRDANKIHTKWILKLFGLRIVNNSEKDVGRYVHVSKENDI